MYRLVLSFLTLVILLFSGCGGGSSGSSSTTTGAGGAGMKGPFVQGSSVKAYELDANGSRSSTFASTTTTDNLGHYNFSSLGWTGATELVMSGNYLNENNGSTAATATLSAIINITSGQSVNANINVLTDLAAKNIKSLMLAGSTLTTAKVAAKTAVTQLFDINLTAGVELEDLDLTVGSGSLAKANADLLRISAAISAKPTVLAQLEEAIEDGNVTNDRNGSLAFATLAQAVNDVNLTQVSNNLEENLSITGVPDANDTDANASFASNAHAPVIGAIATQNKNEDAGAFNIALSATDEDGDSVTFTDAVSSDTSKVGVSLSGTTLTITPQANANGTVTITVTASDGTLIDTKTFNVVLVPQNDVPIISHISNITKDEDSSAFTVDLNATDIDGDDISFDANSSDISKAVVNVNGTTLTITPQPSANGVVTINVSANDGHGGVATTSFTLSITAVNDAPILANSTGTVEENATAGTVVGHVTIVSAGDDPIVSFSLNGVGANNFDINNSGYITVKAGSSLDYESVTEYNLTATANNGDESNIVSMDITITDIPDVVPTLDTTLLTVDENTTGFIKNILNSSGDRPITSISIISGNNDGNFSISNDGNLSVVGNLDYETISSYNLEINATNESGSAIRTITINVGNVIDTPPTLAPFVGSIDENSPIGSIVGDINITNIGDGNITGFTFSNSNFASNEDAKIIINGSLDYETNHVYNFTMYATSSAGNSNTVDVNITVNDVNEAPIADDANFTTPKDINLSINLQPYVHDEDEDQNLTGTFSNPSHGNITNNGEGHLIYSPNNGYIGTDSFTYTVEDNGTNPGPLTSNTAIVYITVTASYSGAANPGDFANFTVNGDRLDYNISGEVFGSSSGSLTLQDVTGNGIFFVSDIGNGNLVKIAKSTNLGIAVVPVNSTNTTMIMGLQVAQNDINESAIWNKSYIYAEMGEDEDGRYVDGYIMEVDNNHSVTLTDTEDNVNSGCWKTIKNHIVAKMGTNDCSTVDDDNATVRVVIRPPVASGRAGMIVDLVDGSGVGIGLEQRAINIQDMNGTFDAYSYKFDGSDEVFLQIQVTNDGSTARYVATPYICDANGCSLDNDAVHQTSGNIAINKLCDGTSYDNGSDLSGVMCVENIGMGFIDVDEGYFMISNDDEMIFGSKHH